MGIMANQVKNVSEIYLMNFLFDLQLGGYGSFNGQFLDEPLTTPQPALLERSKNWLILQGTHAGKLEDFIAAGKAWTDHGDISASTLLIRPPSNQEHGAGVLIRVALGPGPSEKAQTGTLEVELAICFGNANPARQAYASPFKEIPPGVVRTTFHWSPMPPNQPDGSWCFDIGEVLEWPQRRNELHRYGFALGIRVHGAGDPPLDFSMDPEMDVSL